jgi:hypothetical protein
MQPALPGRLAEPHSLHVFRAAVRDSPPKGTFSRFVAPAPERVNVKLAFGSIGAALVARGTSCRTVRALTPTALTPTALTPTECCEAMRPAGAPFLAPGGSMPASTTSYPPEALDAAGPDYRPWRTEASRTAHRHRRPRRLPSHPPGGRRTTPALFFHAGLVWFGCGPVPGLLAARTSSAHGASSRSTVAPAGFQIRTLHRLADRNFGPPATVHRKHAYRRLTFAAVQESANRPQRVASVAVVLVWLLPGAASARIGIHHYRDVPD